MSVSSSLAQCNLLSVPAMFVSKTIAPHLARTVFASNGPAGYSGEPSISQRGASDSHVPSRNRTSMEW